jgi:hypothetical protein
MPIKLLAKRFMPIKQSIFIRRKILAGRRHWLPAQQWVDLIIR